MPYIAIEYKAGEPPQMTLRHGDVFDFYIVGSDAKITIGVPPDGEGFPYVEITSPENQVNEQVTFMPGYLMKRIKQIAEELRAQA